VNFTVIQWSVKSNKDLIDLWEEPVVSCGVLDGEKVMMMRMDGPMDETQCCIETWIGGKERSKRGADGEKMDKD
jgi:hypothetical protein